MQELNKKTREYNNWHRAMLEVIPEYRSAIEPYSRADLQFLLPINKDSIVLDAGAMWGALTIPIAQYCKEVYAVDKTAETVEFLAMRAEQMGFENIHTVNVDIASLPFPNEYFDIAIMNGVLEWIPMHQDINLETYWYGKVEDNIHYINSPEQEQLRALREMRRVIKPSGFLCLAIENRFGYQYIMGYPDDHVNIKYVSLLPRFLANIITKAIRGCQYRAYTYSIFGYDHILRESGFKAVGFYGAFPHYIDASTIVPIGIVKDWKDR